MFNKLRHCIGLPCLLEQRPNDVTGDLLFIYNLECRPYFKLCRTVISAIVGDAPNVGTGWYAYRICFQPSRSPLTNLEVKSEPSAPHLSIHSLSQPNTSLLEISDGNWALAVPGVIRWRISEQHKVWACRGIHQRLSRLWVKDMSLNN